MGRNSKRIDCCQRNRIDVFFVRDIIEDTSDFYQKAAPESVAAFDDAMSQKDLRYAGVEGCYIRIKI